MMKEKIENRESTMMQVRRNSVAVKNYVYSSKLILYILDCVLSLFVLPFLSTAFWVSVDYLYLYKIPDTFSKIGVVCFCALLYIFLHTASKSIYRFVVQFSYQSKVRFHIAAKTYVYVSAVAGVIVYDGIDSFTEDTEWANNIWVNIFMVVSGFSMLFWMKCYVHLAGFGNDVDNESTPEEVFLFPFRIFEYSWKKSKFLYLLDSVSSVFIVGFLVILVWKGSWAILDIVIFPSDSMKFESACVSLGIGYASTSLTCILQPLMKKFLRKYEGWKQTFGLDTYILVSFCGCINVWRGIWMFLEEYSGIDKSLSIGLVLHLGSFLCLAILNASTTLLVRGVYIDADGSADECFDFPCSFFRSRFQPKKNKKILEELDKLNNPQQIQIISNNENGKVTSSWPDAKESIELTADINEKFVSATLIENQENDIREQVQ